MKIPFGTGAYRRDAGSFPEIRCVNMFAEKTPTAEGEVALISRWGLLSSATRGSGPVQAVMFKEGVFDGDVFTVSGGTLYRGATSLGAIVGSGPVSFAFSDTELVLTRGWFAYSYNGEDLEEIAFPDGAHVTAVAFLAGLFLYARAETAKWYWSAVLDGRSVDALDFATAESAPDQLLDIQVMRGNLYLIGGATIEPWFPTGALDLPFTRVDQRLYSKGAIATGCSWELDNTLWLIGNDGLVYRLGDVPERISDHGIEERIAASGSHRAFVIEYQGHKFFCVRLDTGTWAFDAATQQWCEFASHDRDNWRAQCAATVGTTVYLGDDEDGTLWTFTDAAEDAGGVMASIWTAGFHLKGGAQPVDSLLLEASVGRTDYLTGQGENPIVEMRTSRSAGADWGEWRSAYLGAQGKYRNRARWTRLGRFDFPGGLIEFRVTDPTKRRVSGVYINEDGGGRSR